MTAAELLRIASNVASATPVPAPAAPAPVAPAAPVSAPVVAPVVPTPAPVPAPAAPVAVPASPIPATLVGAALVAHGASNDDIMSKAVLVSLSVSMPGNEKVDRKVTHQVQQDQKMGRDSGKWDKTVFPKPIYKALATVVGACRTFHYSMTLPYGNSGQRMLPLANHGAYCAGMRQYKSDIAAARETFLKALPTMVEWAKAEHNGAFDPTLYVESKLRDRFGFDIGFDPIPASSHYAVQLRDILGEDAAAIDERVRQAAVNAEADLWDRMIDPLRNLVTILSKREAGDRTKVTESLLGTIAEIAKLAPALNVNGNPRIAEFAALAEQAFKGFSTEEISEDSAKRKAAIAAANDILRRMQGIARP